MSILRSIAVVLGLALCSTGAALASTVASLKLTGDLVDLSVSIDTSTATFDYGQFDVALAPGQTLRETFTYTVQVTDDGLPAAREWSFCTPVSYADCGPNATGFEQAYVSIDLGRDTRSVTDRDYWIDDTSSFLSFNSVTGKPGLYSGTLVYTATNTSLGEAQFATVSIVGAVFADVAAGDPPAVPEPATAAMWLAGLGLAALRLRRRRA